MALLFNATTSVVTGPSITFGNNITWAAWIYATGSGIRHIIRHGGQGANNVRSIFYLNAASRLQFDVGVISGSTLGSWQGNIVISANTWHHVAVKHPFGSTPAFFLNGVNSGLFSATSPGAAAVLEPRILYIGNQDILNLGFNGRLQDVAIWRRALSDAEIAIVYQQGVYAVHTAGLGPFYTFRDAPIIDGVDRAWRGWDATLSNTTPIADAPAAVLKMTPTITTPLPVMQPHSSRAFTALGHKIILPSTVKPARMTVMAWIKRDGAAFAGNVWQILGHGAVTQGWMLSLAGTAGYALQFEAHTSATTGSWRAAATTNTTDSYHVAVTFDFGAIGNLPLFYVNGVSSARTLVTTPTGTFLNQTVPYYIGADPANFHGANGKIQGIALWDRVLTAAEIATVYARGVFAVDHTGLRFAIAPDGRDLSGCGFHATQIVGTTLSDPLPEKNPYPEFSEPVWLVKIGTKNQSGVATPWYLADQDFQGNDDAAIPIMWDGALVEDLSIQRSTTDTFWGYEELQNVTLKIANPDGKYNALWDTDPRETPVKIWRGDARTGWRYEEFTGMVVQYAREDYHIVLSCANLDLAAFETEIPGDTVTTAEFGELCPAAGETISHILGNVPKVTLPYVQDNIPGGLFRYLLPTLTTTGSTMTFYREAPEAQGAGVFEAITPAEYSVSSAVFPGRVVVGFGVRQEKFGGGMHTIVADIVTIGGAGGNRTPVWAIMYIISTMLRRPVNYLSFEAAANAFEAANPGFVIDGLLDERKPAREYLDELLLICRGRLSFDEGWKITLDTMATYADLHIRDGVGEGEQNLVTPKGRAFRDTKDQISVYKLEHRWDYQKKEYTQTKARPVWVNGLPKIYSSNFLRDGVSADKVLNRLALEEQYGSEELEGDLSPEATPVREGQIALATYAGLGLAGEHYRVHVIGRDTGVFPVSLRRWHPNLYTYIAAPIDGDPLLGTETEEEIVGAEPAPPPTVVTGLVAYASGVDLATDGGASAWIELSFTAPSVNVAGVRGDVRRSPDGGYQQGYAILHYPGGPGGMRLSQLIPGMPYDIRVVAFNGANLTGPAATITYAAPSDATIPPAPTGVTATAAANKTVHVTMAPSSAIDVAGYDWEIQQPAGTLWRQGSVATSPNQPSISIALEEFAYNVTYYMVIWAFDYSGNRSTSAAGLIPFTFPTPSNPSAFIVSGRGVEFATDGGVWAWTSFYVEYQYFNGLTLRVDHRRWSAGGTEPWHYGSVNTTAATTAVVVRGLIPGVAYDFRAVQVSILNIASSGVSVVGDGAASDTVAPSMPTSLNAYAANRTVEFLCIPGAEADLSHVEWEIWTGYSGAGGGSGTGSRVSNGSVSRTRDAGRYLMWAFTAGALLAYGTTYYVRVSAVDFSGNRSNWTASVSFVYTTQSTPDITANAVHQWIYGGLTSGSVTADNNFRVAADLLMDVLQGSIIFFIATTVITNTDSVDRIFGFQLSNVTSGQLFPVHYTTIPAGGIDSFTMALFDFAASAAYYPGGSPGSGDGGVAGRFRYRISLICASGPAISHQSTFIQLAEMKR